ncbi:hypothetical protein ACFVMC_08975 [Nocardia sp. NPDC127579]|uniref:hypothetical protein n=1 Tax=Nocardia sp. NPDC127579 TaxID=3345402 RepID=UPI00363D6BD1
MAGNEEFENLSSKELHDAAVKLAVRHGDVKFLWQLLTRIPAAAAEAGEQGEAEVDVNNTAALLHDYVHAGEGDLAEQLRPFYLEYLSRHS